MQNHPLPRWGNVNITMRDGSIRQGHLLVDHGVMLTVEYKSPAGRFQCRRVHRSQVELLPTELCGIAHDTRPDRVCAAARDHVGTHSWVIRTERED